MAPIGLRLKIQTLGKPMAGRKDGHPLDKTHANAIIGASTDW